MAFFSISFILSASFETTQKLETKNIKNSQNTTLLSENYTSRFYNFNRGGPSEFDYLKDGVLLVPNTPSIDIEQITNLKKEKEGKIKYTVVKGDTLSSLAKLFNISENTIIIENKINKKTLKIGQELTILPVSGVTYKVQKGDNIWTISERHSAKREDVLDFNEIEDANNLQIGQILTIPNGKKPISRKVYYNTSSKITSNGDGYYGRPMLNARLTSDYGKRGHGHHRGLDYSNGVVGSDILASASGVVTTTYLKCTSNGYIGNKCGGGYGNHIIIKHSNGTSTLYAHLSKIYIKKGVRVSKGQVIGGMGNTGNSTGAHLHFEIINSKGQRIKPPKF